LALTSSDAPARPARAGGPLLTGGPLRASGRVATADLSLSVRPALPGRPAVSGPRVLRWRLPDPPARLTADPLVPTLLLLAMRRGEDVRLDGGVSAKLLAGAEAAQDVVLGWDAEVRRRRTIATPPQRRARIVAEVRDPGPRAPGVAAFFTAGVDSFHTVLRHLDEIDALVYVHGMDVALEKRGLRARVVRGIRRAADALGKPLLEVETDVRRLSDSILGWTAYNGAVLASVAHLLAPRFGTVYVPATLTLGRLRPLGSHPDLDHLWGTEEVELVHDGMEAERLDKVRLLAGSEAARHSLRVCWTNDGGAYNCGHCEKCLRTMLAVAAVGALEDFTTFPPLAARHAVRTFLATTSAARRPAWEMATRALAEAGTAPAAARTAQVGLTVSSRLPPMVVARAKSTLETARRTRAGVHALRPPRVSPATAAALTRYLDADTGVGPDRVDVAILFGSESLQAPFVAADVLRAGQADWLLLTGGRSRHTGVEEARRNLSIIEAEGLPTDRVILEEASSTTNENVLFSLPLLAERFGDAGPRSVLVVAKWHHSRRAVMTLRRHLPPGVRYSVFGYDPGRATRPGWARTADGRWFVLDEWRTVQSYLRAGAIVEVRRDGDVWV
jgi:uncharacterized SAM-binding protein YcdF (DUF218 family)